VQALLTSEVRWGLLGTADARAQIQAGKLKALGQLRATRSELWPDVPTLKELGYDVEVLPLLMLAGPKGMDPAVVRRLHDVFRKAAYDPAFQKVLDGDNQAVIYMDADACRKYALERFEEERKIVAEFGLAQQQP
jgi:tripartite-type tricarboxylate transporter receptor subunit TctC